MRSAGNFNPEWGYLAPAPSFMRTMRVVLVATAIGATAGAAVVISLIDRPTGRGNETASVTPRAIVTSAQAAPAAEMPAAAAASVAAPVQKTAAEPAMAPASAGATAIVPQTASAISPQVVTPPAAALAPSADNTSAPSPPIAASQLSVHAAVPDNSAASDAAAVTAKHSTGMAALSEASPSSEALHAADEPDQALIPPEPIPAEKKARHHVASAAATDGRNRPVPSLGSVLRRIFNTRSAGTSYYPNH
jgi:hypothetical protein